MKRQYILLIMVFFCTITPTSSQNILPAPELHPKWAVCSSNLEGVDDTIMYSFGAQFTFCDTLWQEVEEIRPDLSINTRGYYRESNDGNKGFFKFDSSCEAPSYLMYDFTVEQGDTVTYPLGGWYGDQVYFNDLIFAGTYMLNELEVYLFYTIPGPFVAGTDVNWIREYGAIRHPFPILLPCLGANWSCEVSFHVCCQALDTLPQNTSNCPLPLNRFYVDQDAIIGDQTGLDWENAFIDLQDALDLSSWGDEIWVAEGLYTPTSTSDRTISFAVPNGVRIYGGFEGVESYRNERNIPNNTTVLSGQIGDTQTDEDNSYHVVTFLAADTVTLLDGFTIEKGMANNSNMSEGRFGGGVLVNTTTEDPICEPRIQNCILRENTAAYGGGLACNANTNRMAYPRIRNCGFQDNEATTSGGGLYFKQEGYSAEPPVLLDSCFFENNDAFLQGGGMFVENLTGGIALLKTSFERDSCILNGGGLLISTGSMLNPLVIIDDCHFKRSYATGGGGLSIINSFSLLELDTAEYLLDVIINNSSFIENTAREEGGGIEFYTSAGASRLNMSNCTITNNTLVQSGNGGGMQLKTDSHGKGWYSIKNSHFNGNSSSSSHIINGYGGLFIEGSFFGAEVVAKITNSVFTNNTNAIMAVAGSMGWLRTTISNCSFFNNGIRPIRSSWNPNPSVLNTHLYFYNNIVWEPQGEFTLQSGSGGLNGIDIAHSLFSDLDCSSPSGITACGEGIITDINPLFYDAENGNLRTASCSVVRNSGTNGVLDSLGLFMDIAGNSRILEDIVDMGAYEQNSDFVTLNNFTQEGCPGESLAVITVDTVSAQVPLSITWDNTIDIGEGLMNLSAGDYTIYIEDALGCMDTFMQTIPIVPPIQINSEVTNASSNTAMDGSILVSAVSGGTSPYTVLWSTEDTSLVVENLLPGAYSLTITDAEGCTEVFPFQVSFPDNISTLPGDSHTWMIAPNPLHAGESLGMVFSAFEKQEYEISLINTLGQVLWHAPIVIEQNEQYYEVQLPINQSGVYQLLLQTDSGKVVAVQSLIGL